MSHFQNAHDGFVKRVLAPRAPPAAASTPAEETTAKAPAAKATTTKKAAAPKAAETTTTTAAPVATTTTTTTPAAVVVSSSATTKPAVVKTTTTKAPKAVATTSSSQSASLSLSSTSSAVSATNSLAGANVNNAASTSTSHTGVIAGVVIAAVVLIGAGIAGLFIWKKVKAKRLARGSPTALLGGGAGAGFKKHVGDEDDFGNSAHSGHGGFGASEKQPNAGFAGYGAVGMQQAHSYQRQSVQQQNVQDRPSWEAPSYSSNTYPPQSATSTQHLMDKSPPVSPFADPAAQSQQNFAAAGKGLNGPQTDYGFPPAPIAAAASIPVGAVLAGQQQAPSQGPFMDSPGQGKIYVVRNTFEPSQADELIIYPGDRVQVLVTYDDGWALGINLDSGAPPSKGVFPFDCVADPSQRTGTPQNQQPQAQQQQQQAQQLEHATETETLKQSPVQSAPRQSEDQTRPSSSYRFSDEPAPQLAPLRSDSPLGASFPSHPTPNPTIQISSSSPPEKRLSLPGTGNSASGAPSGAKVKRTSSLIASRDASLFVALGEVLDRDGTPSKAT